MGNDFESAIEAINNLAGVLADLVNTIESIETKGQAKGAGFDSTGTSKAKSKKEPSEFDFDAKKLLIGGIKTALTTAITSAIIPIVGEGKTAYDALQGKPRDVVEKFAKEGAKSGQYYSTDFLRKMFNKQEAIGKKELAVHNRIQDEFGVTGKAGGKIQRGIQSGVEALKNPGMIKKGLTEYGKDLGLIKRKQKVLNNNKESIK